MVLNNVRLINNGAPASIQVAGKKIVAVKHEANNKEIFQLHFDSALAFPGLINSHDHLDFNCFPQMGNRVYESYVEWGNTILQSYKTKITEVLSIPKPLRVQWGYIKICWQGLQRL